MHQREFYNIQRQDTLKRTVPPLRRGENGNSETLFRPFARQRLCLRSGGVFRAILFN